MITHIYRGDQRVDTLDPRDRGLAYGDGVFETILIHGGEAIWWSAHLQRLARGCEILGIALPDAGFLRIEVDALSAGCSRGVLKLIVTRGVGARGYAGSPDALPTLLLSLSNAPEPAPRDGLNLRWCATPLAIQPRLAGIKHLNRLEQVLARAEWSDSPIHEGVVHEGLQCDTAGRVVSATSANLFALRNGRWSTPPVTECGIAGLCRAWLMQHVAGTAEAALTRSDVESADALVLCNSVRGILPVAALGERRWPSLHVQTIALQRQLAELEPAFALVNDLIHPSEDA
jgi:4-amino-4-deoxychorismate lyase